MRPVEILDTTLRDGELAGDVEFTLADKVDASVALAQAGVDVVEVCHISASDAQSQRTLKEVAAVLPPLTKACALCRARAKDVEACLAVLGGQRGRIHLFAGGSHQQTDSTLRDAFELTHLAASSGQEVEFSPLDATRLELDYLLELCAAVVEAGASIVNLSDTLGVALPHQVSALISRVQSQSWSLGVKLSFHGHNDLGLATANALAAALAGASQLECCVLGLGPRSGNTPLEQVVAALAMHGAEHALSCRVNVEALPDLCRLVAERTRREIPVFQPVVGRAASPHSSPAA